MRSSVIITKRPQRYPVVKKKAFVGAWHATSQRKTYQLNSSYKIFSVDSSWWSGTVENLGAHRRAATTTPQDLSMEKTLTFLHTSPVHIPTFDGLLAEIAPNIPVRHIVDESLLQEAREAGTIFPQLRQRITDTIVDAIAQNARVLLCTCSTIGGCAEEIGRQTTAPVLRVDRPMAERAVTLGSRILVVATVASTLAPTKELITDTARRANKPVQLIEVLCESAWTKFEQGDQEGYLQEITNQLHHAAPSGDVIVLAQASMAKAAMLCLDLSIPILSSPRLGLEAAIRAYRSA